MDLLGWQPPDLVKRFDDVLVRAASLRAKICKAVSTSLKDCGKPREAVADAMSEYLGEATSKAMLDAYASEAKEDHVISLVRFLALVHATGDHRLLQILVEPFGLAVVDGKHIAAIEEAHDVDYAERLASELERVNGRIATRRKSRRGLR